MIDTGLFAPDHLEFFATVTLHKKHFNEAKVQGWLAELVDTVQMQVLMPSHAVSCDDPGNEGTSGIVMLKTSHSSIHIWDQCEQPYAKLVLYSCKAFEVEPILSMLKGLGARVCRWELRDRNHTTEDELLNGQMYRVIAEGVRDFR
jgi:S-adenosylmethionine/arginine decarboxylase-like enzyme